VTAIDELITWYYDIMVYTNTIYLFIYFSSSTSNDRGTDCRQFRRLTRPVFICSSSNSSSSSSSRLYWSGAVNYRHWSMCL